tara:strand:+ start:19341 stop:19997 length:657 start_codon:yes stop_codon:yes gene_type:complete
MLKDLEMLEKKIKDKKGLMLVLSSPSGAGKTSLCKKLLKLDKNLAMSISATTRPKRNSEINGKDYYFISEQRFRSEKNRGNFIETANVFGYCYGTPKNYVEKKLENGTDVIFDIDWQGSQKLADYSKNDLVSIFILPPNTSELRERLKKRNEDSLRTVNKRMNEAKSEISHWIEYDYVLINTDLDKCTKKIYSILQVERLKRKRQTNLYDFINKLLKE